MVTEAQNLTRIFQTWVSVVEIEGLGYIDNGVDYTYRFCTTVPKFAGTSPQYRPYLTKPVDILSQRAPLFGGIPSISNVTVEILDYRDLLTGIQGNLPVPITQLAEDITSATAVFDVDDASSISAGDQIHLGSEAMRVSNVSTNELTCERAVFGTDARKHDTDENVYSVSPFLTGRRAIVYLLPIDANSFDDVRTIGEFAIGKPRFVDFNVWKLPCRSELVYLNRYWPQKPQQWQLTKDADRKHHRGASD